MGSHRFRGGTELSGAGLVFSRHPEDVSVTIQQTFNVQLSVRDDLPEDQYRKEHSEKEVSIGSKTRVLVEDKHFVVTFPHLLTRAQ